PGAAAAALRYHRRSARQLDLRRGSPRIRLRRHAVERGGADQYCRRRPAHRSHPRRRPQPAGRDPFGEIGGKTARENGENGGKRGKTGKRDGKRKTGENGGKRGKRGKRGRKRGENGDSHQFPVCLALSGDENAKTGKTGTVTNSRFVWPCPGTKTRKRGQSPIPGLSGPVQTHPTRLEPGVRQKKM